MPAGEYQKTFRNKDIPTKIIKLNKVIIDKLNKDIVAPFISKNFNSCIDKGEFPNDLKQADNASVHKKKFKTNKTNCRPVSVFSNFSKLYRGLFWTLGVLVRFLGAHF